MLIQDNKEFLQAFDALSWMYDNKFKDSDNIKELYEFISNFKDFIYIQLHKVLNKETDDDTEKLRRKYCKYVIGKLLPCANNVIKSFSNKISRKMMLESDWNIYNKWLDLQDDLMALASYRSLIHLAMYLETDDPEDNKVWKYTLNSTMGSIFYYSQAMILNHEYSNLIKQCPTGFGKCVDENTKVLFWDGEKYFYKPIKEINVGDEIGSLKKDKLVKRKVLNKWETNKLCLKIETDFRIELKVSYEHRLLTKNGYKKSEELTIDDYLYLYDEDFNYFNWVKINKIEKTSVKLPMVDLEIDETHNFIANGIVSHNSKSDCVIICYIFGYNINADIMKVVGNPSVIQPIFSGVVNMLKSQKFGKVFPEFGKYNGTDEMFKECKSGDGAFTLKESKVGRSFYIVNKATSLDGARYNYQFYDDVTQSNEKHNLRAHQSDINKYTSQWSRRCYNVNTVLRWFTGTAYHTEDFLSWIKRDLANNEDWEVDLKTQKVFAWSKFVGISADKKSVSVSVPGLIDFSLGLDKCYSSFPEKYPKNEYLKDYRRNAEEFFAMTQQEPVPSEALAFAYVRLQQWFELPEEIRKNDCRTIAIIDPARKGKDNYACLIFKESKSKLWYLIDGYYKKVSAKIAVPGMCERMALHKVDRICFEQNATDIDLLEEKIKEEMAKNNWLEYTIESFWNNENKEERISRTRDDIKDIIVFPGKGVFHKAQPMGMAMYDIINYTFEGNNINDDSIDCCSMLTLVVNQDNENEIAFFSERL